MGSPLDAAGATKEPSDYATLSMDRNPTGLWTQRSPLRDADVPYLYGKFYSASRFDSLIDGLNREITARLTIARRRGNSVYNANEFPSINSFYPYKHIVNGAEVVRVIADGQNGVIYDATVGQKTAIFLKTGTGRARFQGVNSALYFADGVSNKKWLQPGGWLTQQAIATTQYQVGTSIIDPAGNIEYLGELEVGTIINVALTTKVVAITFSGTGFNMQPNMSFTPQVGAAIFINGQLLIVQNISQSGGNFVVTAFFDHVDYASTADTGSATTTDVGTLATTGTTIPTFAPAYGATTGDGLSTWTNFGTPVFDWGPPAAPMNAPAISLIGDCMMGFWQPFAMTAQMGRVIIDANGFIWKNFATSFTNTRSGGIYPKFQQPISLAASYTFPNVNDGGLVWSPSFWFGAGNVAPIPVLTGPQPWQPNINPTQLPHAFFTMTGGDVCVDSNGNLQQIVAGSGASGSAAPTWNTTYGGNTTDSGLTWHNLGPYLALSFQGRPYSYAYHCIDGSWSTLSPLSPSTNGLLEGVLVSGVYSTDLQVDAVGIFHNLDGQSTPLLLAKIPNNTAGGTWTFEDELTDSALNEFIAGPQAEANNPPPLGMTAPIFHLGRIFAIFQNTVIASGGPDVIVGNGFTAFAPASAFPLTEQPIRLFSGQTSAGPALFVWAVGNIWIIPGAGTTNSPFGQPSIYMADVGISNYDAICAIGSTYYAFTGKSKMVSLDPGAGYIEVGFPIGDQFEEVTTGGGGKIASGVPIGELYDPSSTFVTWAELSSEDSALYVCDGQVGWFRYSPVASPESGFLWSPRAVILGGTSAVQAVETTPGISQLLIGPPDGTPGPILFRDSAVRQDWTDGAYGSYPSYDVKGNIVLCESGEIAEIAHIALKSIAVGNKPAVGLLLGEIAPTLDTPFDWLDWTSCDPPDIQPSETMFSDRYSALQNGTAPLCDNFQLQLDYGVQDAADETIKFSIYGAKHAERKDQ